VFILQNVFSRTNRLILIRPGTNYRWVKGIQNFQIKGQVLFKGEIITKMRWGYFQIYFSRTTEPEELIFK
jgi:hypothetical protein